ncbi:MAG: hypothetical protein [Microvirus sp.]|nr:MAG: hypothetical protein [Microvirus sp.]
MKRTRMSPGASKKVFKRTQGVHPKNYPSQAQLMRGGIRK